MNKGKALAERLHRGNMTKTELFAFREEVRKYLRSDAPESEKDEIREYMESVVMLWSILESRKN